jgi:microcystin degradation protein MlrC
MAELADVIVGYDTYPHVDVFERAVEAFDILVRIVRGEVRPVRAYKHSGMLVVPQGMMTEEGSMKELMDCAFAMEELSGVLNVTVAGGFPYSDVPDAGMSFVVTADGDRELAERCVNELAELAWKRRDSFNVPYLEPRDAIREALSEPQGPVILSEGSDNVGGGGPGDATHLLAHMTDLPVKSLIVIRDPDAVREAFAVGIGGTFAMDVGGKTDDLHGRPVAVRGTVRLLFDGRYRYVGPYMTGKHADMGRTAVVECGNLTVELTEKRVGPYDLGHVLYAGLWPEDFHIIVVKSAIAWQAAFGKFARRVINVDSPGCCSANLRHFEYRQVRRPVYPLELT